MSSRPLFPREVELLQNAATFRPHHQIETPLAAYLLKTHTQEDLVEVALDHLRHEMTIGTFNIRHPRDDEAIRIQRDKLLSIVQALHCFFRLYKIDKDNYGKIPVGDWSEFPKAHPLDVDRALIVALGREGLRMLGFEQPDLVPENTLELPSGRQIRTPPHPAPCSYVRITDPKGVELGYWSSREWQSNPEEVMAALLSVGRGDLDRKPAQTQTSLPEPAEKSEAKRRTVQIA